MVKRLLTTIVLVLSLPLLGLRFFGTSGSPVVSDCTNNESAACTLNATRSASDADFVATNVKSAVNILNVTGTYTGAELITGSTHPLATATYSSTITTPGSTHTKSTPWTELEDSVPANTTGILVFTFGATANGAIHLFDVGTGAASSESALVSNMLLQTVSADAGSTADVYYFPIALAAGTRLSMRAQSGTVSASFFASLLTIQGTSAGDTFTRFTTYGANTGTTRGTQIDPGGSANTKGSWAEISASTANPMRKMLVMLGTGGNVSNQGQAFKIDIGTGAGGGETAILSNLPARTDAGSSAIRPVKYEFPVTIAAGTRLSMRAQSSITDATDRKFDAIIIGMD